MKSRDAKPWPGEMRERVVIAEEETADLLSKLPDPLPLPPPPPWVNLPPAWFIRMFGGEQRRAHAQGAA